MLTLTLKPGHEQRVRHGHPWVFSNEIADDVAAIPPGAAVEIRASNGRFLGRGYANPASLITARILTRDPGADPDSVELYEARLRQALSLRERLLPGRRAYRLVAGEADFLPGLVLDRYEDVLVAQTPTLGMEQRRPLLREAIERVLGPKGVALRNEAAVRQLEGLGAESGVWWGEVPERVRFELDPLPGGRRLQLHADVLGGQKTGFFFDQAENRAFAARVCGGLRVLDVYANTGAWAVGALASGAASGVAIEYNPKTCEIIAENAALNGVQDRLSILAKDAREAMAELRGKGERFDAVFLDPPAFAKTKKKAGVALHAYREVNRMAMELLRPGGLLFTSSCSWHILEDRFEAEVVAAARQLGRGLRQVRRGEQGPDHPVLPAIPESRYLKHMVYEVLEGP